MERTKKVLIGRERANIEPLIPRKSLSTYFHSVNSHLVGCGLYHFPASNAFQAERQINKGTCLEICIRTAILSQTILFIFDATPFVITISSSNSRPDEIQHYLEMSGITGSFLLILTIAPGN